MDITSAHYPQPADDTADRLITFDEEDFSSVTSSNDTKNNSDGTDFDYDSHGLFLGLSHPLPFDITGEATYTRLFDRYRNRNTFTILRKRRDDDIDRVSVRLTRPIDIPRVHKARVYVGYEFVNNDSNVVVYDYDQHTYTAGLILEF